MRHESRAKAIGLTTKQGREHAKDELIRALQDNDPWALADVQ